MKQWTETSADVTLGTNDNDVLLTAAVARFDEFQISTDQPVDVFGSDDNGVTFKTTALSLEDIHAAAAVGTRVLVTAANKMYRIAPGAFFTHLRFQQNGATPATKFRFTARRKFKVT